MRVRLVLAVLRLRAFGAALALVLVFGGGRSGSGAALVAAFPRSGCILYYFANVSKMGAHPRTHAHTRTHIHAQ